MFKLSLLLLCLFVSNLYASIPNESKENLNFRSLYNTCTAACRGGSSAIKAFCRTPILPPQIKALCWGLNLVTFNSPGAVVACKNFCYGHFFDTNLIGH